MLRIADFEKESYVDGVGIRYTIFVQGCAHNCFGCHNPKTHSFDGGSEVLVEDIISDIKKNGLIDGVTLSGGDPFYQASECAELARLVKEELHLSVWTYTGFTIEEIMNSKDKDQIELLEYTDVLVDGLFVMSKRSLELAFRGSSNQRIIDVDKTLHLGEVVLYDLNQ